MAKDKKMVESITSMSEDFAQWYTDVVKKAELCDYASVKGCMVIKPAGYAIWENIQKELAEGKQCGFQCGGGARPSLHFVQPYSCRLTSKYPVRLCRVQCPVGYGQTRKGT